MNIFATSACPVESAVALDDKRVIKMSLESAQIASTALFLHYGARVDGTYAPTHIHHPCVRWASLGANHLAWLCHHGIALLEEADFRWGTKQRKCRSILEECLQHVNSLPDKPLIHFQNSARMSPGVMDYTHVTDTNEAYRLYLSHKWREFGACFTRRDPPVWFRG